MFGIFVHAQDVFFTQAYSNPLQLNPSFAGSVGNSRIVTSYRNQWPLNTANYVTKTFSYDKHIKFLHGGLGFNFLTDRSGFAFTTYPIYLTTRVGLVYSPTFIINKKISVKPSIETDFFQKSIDWSRLTFGDMIDRSAGFVYGSEETPKWLANKTGFDFSTGILVNTNKWNCGFAVFHLFQPDEGLLATSILSRKYIIHSSYTFAKNDSADFAFTPALVLAKQGVHHLTMLSLNFKYKWLRFGAGIRYKDAGMIMLGFSIKRFALNYSYEVNPNNFYNTAGAHEATLTYLFKYTKKVKIKEEVEDKDNPGVKKVVKKKVRKPVNYNVIKLKPLAF